MLVDLSWSMALRGSFQAAKKVSMALHNLITSQYAKDSFYIIGFAAYARELKPHDLPFLQWDDYLLGTNMQHALLLGERLLSKHDVGTKQIIMISDGEPTAHLENGHAQFAYPPTTGNDSGDVPRGEAGAPRKASRSTRSCSMPPLPRSSSWIRSPRSTAAAFSTRPPEQLGEYILVDYVQHKRKKLGRR